MKLSKPKELPDYLCPKAIGHPYGDSENALKFRTVANGDLRCGFCGSLHPVQFMELVDHILEHECKDEIYLSQGKPGKLYIKRPNVRNCDDGVLKFYINHLFTVPEYVDRVNEEGTKFLKPEIVDKVNEAAYISHKYFYEVALPKLRANIALRHATDFRN